MSTDEKSHLNHDFNHPVFLFFSHPGQVAVPNKMVNPEMFRTAGGVVTVVGGATATTAEVENNAIKQSNSPPGELRES